MFYRSSRGIEFAGDDMADTADRIHAVERASNIRRGITIAHDYLPQKPEIKASRESETQREEHAQMLRRDYQAHDYDPETGIPLRETLNRLAVPGIGKRLADGPYPTWDGPPLRDLESYPRSGTRE
jgi:aldehyde:ferredoxin oxidoreductase